MVSARTVALTVAVATVGCAAWLVWRAFTQPLPSLGPPIGVRLVDAPAPRASGAATQGSGAGPTLGMDPPSAPRLRHAYPARSVSQLRRLRGWVEFLRAWKGLPEAVTPAARSDLRQQALTGLADPVVRQNVIFAATLMHPWQEVQPWLEALRQGPDASDGEDALCALAFSGDPAAGVAFRALSGTPSTATVHALYWLDEHEALAEQGGEAVRASLRAYRAVEVLDRRPYFHLALYLVAYNWDPETALRLLCWQPRPSPDAQRDEALLQAWMARYPGHPGTDGMCLRLARMRIAEGRTQAAAEWFARCLAGPDQDRACRARAPLVMLAERVLSIDDLGALAAVAGAAAPSRTLFRYARLRRLAVERGPQAACQAAAAEARDDDGVLGWAWRARRSSTVPRGLSSGMTPLPAGDPLRDMEVAPQGRPTLVMPPGTPEGQGPTIDLLGVRSDWRRGDAGRAAPPPDPWHLDADRLARQFRAWEALAELERRTDAARGAARADLLYKQAAVLYHDRDVYFPCYGTHTFNFGWALDGLAEERALPEGSDRTPTRLAAYAQQAFAWQRAEHLFARIEREHADYPALDKVVFSRAMCFHKLSEYRPHATIRESRDDWNAPWREAIRRAVETFERVAREHPTSTLADDAARAAAYWRRERPDVFAATPR